MTALTLEGLARAVAQGLGDDFDDAHASKSEWTTTRGEKGGRFRDINEPRQPDFLDAARAILSHIEASGYKLVPVEATEEMAQKGAFTQYLRSDLQNHGSDEANVRWMRSSWSAMLTASPEVR